jgi:hypothetical protein
MNPGFAAKVSIRSGCSSRPAAKVALREKATPRRSVYLFAANVYQQDELRGDNKVELSPLKKVAVGEPPGS